MGGPGVPADVAEAVYAEGRYLSGSALEPLSLSPRVLTIWRAGWLAATLILGAVAAAIGIAADGASAIARFGPAVVIGAVGLLAAALGPGAAFRRWRYWVTEDGIEIRHGLFFRSESSIPHFRVQHIDIRQGPLQRLAGVVQLQISTASPASDAELPGVAPGQAELIRRLVLARAEADDAV